MILNRTKLIVLLALFGAIALAFFSGWRDVGFDRGNYQLMYSGILSSEDLALKFYYAKDVTFLLLTIIANYFSENAKLSFLFVCLLSVTTKYFAVKRIAPRELLIFFFMYAIFLSPGLEFAAMRSGLAIGFFMLALAYYEKRLPLVVFFLFAVASHITLILGVLLAYPPVNKLLARHKILYVAITVSISSIGGALINLFPQGAVYAGNQGTLLAYLMPITALVISYLVFYRADIITCIQPRSDVSKFLTIVKPVIYGLIAIAFGMVGVVVTASTRYLEVALCLLLLSALLLYKRSYPNFAGLILLIGYLSYLNISRTTWLAIIDPSFG